MGLYIYFVDENTEGAVSIEIYVSLTYRPVQRAMSSEKWHKQLLFRAPSASRSLDPHRIPERSLGASEALNIVLNDVQIERHSTGNRKEKEN